MIDGPLDIRVLSMPQGADGSPIDAAEPVDNGLFERTLQGPGNDNHTSSNMNSGDVPSAGHSRSLQDFDQEFFENFDLSSAIAAELVLAMPSDGEISSHVLNAEFDQQGGFEELQIVLMSLIASGRLAQRFEYSGTIVSTLASQNAPSQNQTGTTFASTAVDADMAPPRIWLGQSNNTSIGIAQNLSREADGLMSRQTSGASSYERVFAAMLPPRENLLVVTASEETRVFVRNFFDPAVALERIRSFNSVVNGTLSGAHVHVNGYYKGKI